MDGTNLRPRHAIWPGDTAELAELQAAVGPTLDQTLRLMLRHHRAGAWMDVGAVKGAKVAAVRTFAQTLLSEEVGEIGLMKQLQSQLLASAGPVR